MGLQRDQLFPKMIAIIGTQQGGSPGRALLGLIPLLKEVIRGSHSAHDVSARQQATVLRVLGQGNSLLSIALSSICVDSGVSILSELFLHASVLGERLEDARSSHQDLV